MRRIVTSVLISLFLLPASALATEPVPLQGHCVNYATPVLNRDPLPHEWVHCSDGKLFIQIYEKLPDINSLESLDYVFDDHGLYKQYAEPAFIYLNNTWHITPKIYVFEKEAKPFRVKESGRIMMPIRFFTEAIGGEVGFKDGMIRLSYNDTEVLLRSRDTTAYINGKEVQMDQAPHVLYGRTMVPVRFVMEAFGAQLAFDPQPVAAVIQLEGAECVTAELCQPILFKAQVKDPLP